jgi:hypothetical protein
MAEEKILTEKESLAIITSMINKAKCEYVETGISALIWGIVIVFCSVVSFISFYQHWHWADYVWLLTIVAVIPQIIIAIRDGKKRKFKSYNDNAMNGIWISFGVGIFLFSYFINKYNVQHVESVFMIFYGIPTFSTGIARNFKPMIIGGIGCWIIAIISMYVELPYTMLLTAVAAIIAWFIPGLILRARYWKLIKQNV